MAWWCVSAPSIPGWPEFNPLPSGYDFDYGNPLNREPAVLWRESRWRSFRSRIGSGEV